MNDHIAQALKNLFDRHRIVFWYDNDGELLSDFEALDLAGAGSDAVEKVLLDNNEFGLKYRMLRQEPKQKFLVYSKTACPADQDNWLLDVLLAGEKFSTDQFALWLTELGLGLAFAPLVEDHTEFFKAEKTRLPALKKLINSGDSFDDIRLKMLAVCAECDSGSAARLDSILERLLEELALDKTTRIGLFTRCNLEDFFWKKIMQHYGYDAGQPSMADFSLRLFEHSYAMAVEHKSFLSGNKSSLNGEAEFFIKNWKNSRLHQKTFETLSDKYSEILDIETDLNQRDYTVLLDIDLFSLIDVKIIDDLVTAVEGRNIQASEVAQCIRKRKQGYWYDNFTALYEAAQKASEFFALMEELNISILSLDDGVTNYAGGWYKIDQCYRQFVYALQRAEQIGLLQKLAERVDNFYSNNFLLKLNNIWQEQVDACPKWMTHDVPMQNGFFQKNVQPFLHKKHKVCVIISDALRYEVGEELVHKINQEERYQASVEPVLSILPSYTQLGMAALLPHKTLTINLDKGASVAVDDLSSQGTANRVKILKQAIGERATALKFSDFMDMPSSGAGRDLLRDHDVLYIYHNRIDHTGDKLQSEGEAFRAVHDTLDDLVKLVKKLTSANASNILVTADHGFIYQNQILDESEFIDTALKGDNIAYKDRRFVVGEGLMLHDGLRHFKAEALGLEGDFDIQIPKSINRLRLKGSGSRFVHGGAALQEVVVPVIRINKKRKDDVSFVDVEILRSGKNLITTGQMTAVLYQRVPITDKIQGRTLRVGLYAKDGALLSNLIKNLTFDSISENSREREERISLDLNKEAENYNSQDVFLKLEEKHAGTNHYKLYKQERYTLRRSFTTDFDF